MFLRIECSDNKVVKQKNKGIFHVINCFLYKRIHLLTTVCKHTCHWCKAALIWSHTHGEVFYERLSIYTLLGCQLSLCVIGRACSNSLQCSNHMRILVAFAALRSYIMWPQTYSFQIIQYRSPFKSVALQCYKLLLLIYLFPVLIGLVYTLGNCYAPRNNLCRDFVIGLLLQCVVRIKMSVLWSFRTNSSVP